MLVKDKLRWYSCSDSIYAIPMRELKRDLRQFRRPIEARHHRFKRIFLIEKAVLVGTNDSISR